MLDHLDETGKQRAREEAEGPKPQPKERTMAVLKLTVWIGLIEGGIRAFEDIYWNEQRIYWNEQRAATSRH
jgi:hypothetical protein